MNWRSYLEELGIAGTERIIVTQSTYLVQLDEILNKTPIETLRDYLPVQLLWSFSNNLDQGLEKTAFTSFRALGGQSVMPPLDERVLNQVNGLMGDALGKLYVEEHFPPKQKPGSASSSTVLSLHFVTGWSGMSG
jgi:putative endopeptidase